MMKPQGSVDEEHGWFISHGSLQHGYKYELLTDRVVGNVEMVRLTNIVPQWVIRVFKYMVITSPR